jgi:hypothetical protein
MTRESKETLVDQQEIQRWLQTRLPAHLITTPPEVALYDDEIVIMLHIAMEAPAAELSDEQQQQSEQRLIEMRREETRPLRVRLARELQALSKRAVGWGMRAGASEVLFTTRTVPVMTRLGRVEREVLDTLVSAGVAETRSAALAYTVRAFASEHSEWLEEVRAAIVQVERVRARLKHTRRKGGPPTIVPEADDVASPPRPAEGASQ